MPVEREYEVVLVDEAALPLERAWFAAPRAESQPFVESSRGKRCLCHAEVQLIDAGPSTREGDGRLQERATDAGVAGGRCHVHAPDHGGVTALRLRVAHDPDHAREVAAVEMTEDALLALVGERASDEIDRERAIVLERRREGERFDFEGVATEGNERGRVIRTQ